MTERTPMPTFWRVPDGLWKESSRSFESTTRRSPRAVLGWTNAPPWTLSSSGSAPAASGTACPRSSPTTPPCTAPSSAGSRRASWIGCGQPWSRSAKSWAWSTGSGRRPTGRWARPVLGDLVDPNPTDRGKNGVKRSLLVKAGGGPPSVVVAGANVRDDKLLARTLDAVVIKRPEPTDEAPQHLCLDKGFDNKATRTTWRSAPTSRTSGALARRS